MIDLLQKIGIKIENLGASSKEKTEGGDNNAFTAILDGAKKCFDKTKQLEEKINTHEKNKKSENLYKNNTDFASKTRKDKSVDTKEILTLENTELPSDNGIFEKETALLKLNVYDNISEEINIQNDIGHAQTNKIFEAVTEEQVASSLNMPVENSQPDEKLDSEKTNPIKITNNDIREYVRFHENIFKNKNISDMNVENPNIAETDNTNSKTFISKIFNINTQKPQSELSKQADNSVKFDFSDNKVVNPNMPKIPENTIKFDFSDNKVINSDMPKIQDNTVKFDFSDNKVVNNDMPKIPENTLKFDFSDNKVVNNDMPKIPENTLKFDFSDNKVVNSDMPKLPENDINFDFSDNKVVNNDMPKLPENDIKFDFSDNKDIRIESLKVISEDKTFDTDIKFEFSKNQNINNQELKLSESIIKPEITAKTNILQESIKPINTIRTDLSIETNEEIKENIDNMTQSELEFDFEDINLNSAFEKETNLAYISSKEITQKEILPKEFISGEKINIADKNIKTYENIDKNIFDSKDKDNINIDFVRNNFVQKTEQTYDKNFAENKNNIGQEPLLKPENTFSQKAPIMSDIKVQNDLNSEKSNNITNEQEPIITETKISAKENEFSFNNMSNNSFNFTSLNDIPSQLTKLTLNKTVDFSEVMNEKTAQINEQNFIEHVKNEGLTKLSKGITQISMILRPESLGRLHINIASTGEGITAQLTASNQQAADILNKNISSLKQSLQEQGINVTDLNVKVSDTQNSEMSFENRGQQNNERMNDFLDGKSHENSSSKFVQEKLAKSLKNNNEYNDDTQQEEIEIKTHSRHEGLVDYKI